MMKKDTQNSQWDFNKSQHKIKVLMRNLERSLLIHVISLFNEF